jgi:hypothetical protein
MLGIVRARLQRYIASGVDPALVQGAAFDGQYWFARSGLRAAEQRRADDALHAVIGP